MTTDTDSDYDIDLERLCWALAHSVTDFEYRLVDDAYEDHADDPETVAYERGYAAGYLDGSLFVLEQLDMEGVDVVAAAEAFAEREDAPIASLWVTERGYDPDFRETETGGSFTGVSEADRDVE